MFGHDMIDTITQGVSRIMFQAKFIFLLELVGFQVVSIERLDRQINR